MNTTCPRCGMNLSYSVLVCPAFEPATPGGTMLQVLDRYYLRMAQRPRGNA